MLAEEGSPLWLPQERGIWGILLSSTSPFSRKWRFAFTIVGGKKDKGSWVTKALTLIFILSAKETQFLTFPYYLLHLRMSLHISNTRFFRVIFISSLDIVFK